MDTVTPKEGMHHPRGVLGLWGRGIRQGVRLEGIDNLDIAPTLLSLLDIPVPAMMKGRVLREAWDAGPQLAGVAGSRTVNSAPLPSPSL